MRAVALLLATFCSYTHAQNLSCFGCDNEASCADPTANKISSGCPFVCYKEIKFSTGLVKQRGCSNDRDGLNLEEDQNSHINICKQFPQTDIVQCFCNVPNLCNGPQRCYSCKGTDVDCTSPDFQLSEHLSKECATSKADKSNYACFVKDNGDRGCAKADLNKPLRVPLCDESWDENKDPECFCWEQNCNMRELSAHTCYSCSGRAECAKNGKIEFCDKTVKSCVTLYSTDPNVNGSAAEIVFQGCKSKPGDLQFIDGTCRILSWEKCSKPGQLECYCDEQNCNDRRRLNCFQCEGNLCQTVDPTEDVDFGFDGASPCKDNVAQTCIIKVTKESDRVSKIFRGCVPYSLVKGVEPNPLPSSSWPHCRNWSYKRKRPKNIEACQCEGDICNENEIKLRKPPAISCAVCNNNEECKAPAVFKKCEQDEICFSLYVLNLRDDGIILPGKIDKRGCIPRSSIDSGEKINDCNIIKASTMYGSDGKMKCYCDSDHCNKRKKDIECHACQNCPSAYYPGDNDVIFDESTCNDTVASACRVEVAVTTDGQLIVNRQCKPFLLYGPYDPQRCDEWDWKLGDELKEGECWCMGQFCNDKDFLYEAATPEPHNSTTEDPDDYFEPEAIEPIVPIEVPDCPVSMKCHMEDLCFIVTPKVDATPHHACGIREAYVTDNCSASDGCIFVQRLYKKSRDRFYSRGCSDHHIYHGSTAECTVKEEDEYWSGICHCTKPNCNGRGEDENWQKKLEQINSVFKPIASISSRNLNSMKFMLAGPFILYCLHVF